MKCAALLKGSGSGFKSIMLIIRCTGRKRSRKSPASAITNFLEIDENRILFIVVGLFK
jgi:ATP-dependent protease Clp ATPase subunit